MEKSDTELEDQEDLSRESLMKLLMDINTLNIARRAHEGQVDNLGQPYIEHALAVAASFDGYKKSAALLHDVLEDSTMTCMDLINAGVPQEVVSLVVILTKNKHESYKDYIRRVSDSPDATDIKLADLEHNMHPDRARGLSASLRKRYIWAWKTLRTAQVLRVLDSSMKDHPEWVIPIDEDLLTRIQKLVKNVDIEGDDHEHS